MKLTQKKIDDYNIELTVTEDAAQFSKAIKEAAQVLGKEVSIKGFRKGKVPQSVLESHVGKDAIINEASEILLQKSTREALKILNLIPVTQNKADVKNNKEGEDFVFTLTFTPFPTVKLGEYKDLDAEKVVEPVTDEQVDEQIEQMRKHHANLTDAAEGDKIVEGDFITLDYSGSVDGEKFEGGTAKDQPLEIGAHKFIGDFEEQLVGAKVGEERTVKVTFPEKYHAEELAGKDAVFECKINSIKHRELPELNDEFAKKVSKFETLAEYKADVRKNMEAAAERRADEAQREAIIEKAVANMEIDLPPVMVETRVTQMIDELGAQLGTQGMSIEQYMAFSGMDMDKLREEYKDTAKKNILTDIMLEKVADVEKINVEQAELEREISIMAQMYRTPAKQIYKYLQANGQLFTVANTIRRRKAMKFIFDNMARAVKAEDVKTDAKVDAKAETKADTKVAAIAEVKAEPKAEKVDAKVAEAKVADAKVETEVKAEK
ncbi:MAG: trigger factor [Selenomonadaceae bacterium]|nr:trigger factor [Selenomonadaceae bacterium]